jgi:hypothetical protein
LQRSAVTNYNNEESRPEKNMQGGLSDQQSTEKVNINKAQFSREWGRVHTGGGKSLNSPLPQVPFHKTVVKRQFNV